MNASHMQYVEYKSYNGILHKCTNPMQH